MCSWFFSGLKQVTEKRKLNSRPSHVTQPEQSGARFSGAVVGNTFSNKTVQPQLHKPSPSNFLKNLAKASRAEQKAEIDVTTLRSSGFADTPPTPDINNNQDTSEQFPALKRDDRLALIEDLEPGPIDHIPPADDPDFEKLEPNSGIRLSYGLPIL